MPIGRYIVTVDLYTENLAIFTLLTFNSVQGYLNCLIASSFVLGTNFEFLRELFDEKYYFCT